jgi:hypothetical protein
MVATSRLAAPMDASDALLGRRVMWIGSSILDNAKRRAARCQHARDRGRSSAANSLDHADAGRRGRVET